MNQNGNMNINEFKGIYYNDNKQQKFFEGGAHFSYKELYHLLEILQSPKEKSDSSRIVKSERMKVIYLHIIINSQKQEMRNQQTTFKQMIVATFIPLIYPSVPIFLTIINTVKT